MVLVGNSTCSEQWTEGIRGDDTLASAAQIWAALEQRLIEHCELPQDRRLEAQRPACVRIIIAALEHAPPVPKPAPPKPEPLDPNPRPPPFAPASPDMVLVPGPKLRRMLGVSAVTLWRWRQNEDFPRATTINGRNYFPWVDVQARL